MPIYEFYCEACHRLFRFLSRRVDTTTAPDCPRCGRRRIERQISLFSVSCGRKEEGEGEGDDDLDLPFDIDESKLESVFASLEKEAEGIDEDDPRQATALMRKFFDATGLPVGPGMEEALRRMESGEDPDEVEQEMGDVLEDETEGWMSGKKAKRGGLATLRRRFLPPAVDDELYEL